MNGSLDHLNLNLLRVFHVVYETRSMTEAASILHLTQSGVSQHIQSLESEIKVKLFDRIQKKIVPTAAAKVWYEVTHENLKKWNEAWNQTTHEETELRGTVRIGMPVEFGNNIVLPKISEFAKKNLGVRFKFQFGFASVMNRELVDGTLDLAFVDEYRMDSRIQTEQVYEEVHELCSTDEKLVRTKKLDHRFFETLRYVDYQDDSSVLMHWFSHHFGFKHMRLNVVATVMDVQAISRLIQGGVGVGILPKHQLERLKQSGVEIYAFKGAEKPLVNEISLASLKGRTQTPSVSAVIKFLQKSF